MSSNTRLRVGLAVLAALCTAPAAGAVPWSQPSVAISANRINLVGYRQLDTGVYVDSLAYGAVLEVTVLDGTSNPIAGVPVALDFSGCLNDVSIGFPQHFHEETVDCLANVVQNTTNSAGRVSFVVMGGAKRRLAHPASCVKVFAAGVLVGSIGAGTYDQNCLGGMNMADLAYFWSDIIGSYFQDRSDMNGDGYLSLADIAYAWSVVSDGFTHSPAVFCTP